MNQATATELMFKAVAQLQALQETCNALDVELATVPTKHFHENMISMLLCSSERIPDPADVRVHGSVEIERRSFVETVKTLISDGAVRERTLARLSSLERDVLGWGNNYPRLSETR